MVPTFQERQLLADPDTYTTVLLGIIQKHYGRKEEGDEDYLDWTPATVFMELEEDFQVQLPVVNKDKIAVGYALLLSDDFYKRPPRFVEMCNVLSGSELSSGFDKATAVECAWGMTEAMLLSPPEEDDPEPYHLGIRHYLGHIVDEEGLINPPDMLRMALRDSPGGIPDIGDIPVEDPGLFAASYDIRTDRSQWIQETLEQRLREVFEQLVSVSGMQSVQELISRMRSR